MNVDLVTALSKRKTELQKTGRELKLVDELLSMHSIPSAPAVATPATKLASKTTKIRKVKPVPGSMSVGHAINEIVRKNNGKTMALKDLVADVTKLLRANGSKVQDLSIATTISGRGINFGLKRQKSGQYKCLASKSTYTGTIGRPVTR